MTCRRSKLRQVSVERADRGGAWRTLIDLEGVVRLRSYFAANRPRSEICFTS